MHVAWWCNGPIGRWTCDQKVVGLMTLGRVAIKWLLLGWYVTNTKVNSAFHPSRVGKWSTGLLGCGYI